jgi:hypothetical protein
MFLKAMVEKKNIQKLQKTFNARHQKKVWKGLYYQICAMNHIMHTCDKWSILMLDLNYNSISKALEGTNPINTKTN